ncbi:MAG: MFS transporter [Planctomycetia bacterium]|nr:MFS transporter [Planctomycetia bacterium]
MTWPRWRLVLLLMAICFLAHFNRVSMAVAGDMRIMSQYEISPTRMGIVYSAFLAAYTMFMIPGGWLIDQRGPRFSLQLVCFGSAGFVFLTGCVGITVASTMLAFPAFLAIRSLMGLVSAPLHPAAANAVSLDIPIMQRSAANGLVTGAALLGVASTYPLFGYLVDWFDWPGAFVVVGSVTAACGWLWAHCEPVKPIGANVAISADEAPSTASAIHARRQSPHTIRSYFRRNKSLLLLTLSYAAVGYFQYLFFYWMHYYFETILELGSRDSRLYSAIPPLAMALGMPLGGWLSDRIQSLFGWRAARTGLVMSAMTASAGLLLLGISAAESFWIVVWLSLALGVLGTAEGPFWVTAVEAGGRRGGLSAAILNTGGNAGGILAPVVTPWISDTLEFGWQTGIAVGSLVCVLGAALWFWIDIDSTIEL